MLIFFWKIITNTISPDSKIWWILNNNCAGGKKVLKLVMLSSLNAKHLPHIERNQQEITNVEQFRLKGTFEGDLVQPQHSEEDQFWK